MKIRHNYIDAGSGEPLILLHGNGESCEYFEHQIAYFEKNYRVIALDTRGHGKTERGTAPFTIAQFAEDLYKFMQSMKIEKAHILGFSDGGNIALVFALKYPECVDKLILNGANLYSSGVKPTVQVPIIIGYKIASLFAGKSPEAKKNAEMLGLMVNDPNLTQEECAQNLGVALSTLQRWLTLYRDNDGDISSRGSGNYASDEQKEIARLKKELRDTQDALEILKKAIGILGKN